MEFGERRVELAQVLRDERAQHGVEARVRVRDLHVQIGDAEVERREASARDGEHSSEKSRPEARAPDATRRSRLRPVPQPASSTRSPAFGASRASVNRASIATTGFGVAS